MSYFFGPYALHNSQIFFETPLSLAIVNLKPIVPGHVLIIPKRVEPRIMNLSTEEYSDLFLTTRVVVPKLEQFYYSEAMNIAVQDGSAAGQSVPHVHIHILPRKTGRVHTF
jgi:bis(5'-adenosyl)-triphosphatase